MMKPGLRNSLAVLEARVFDGIHTDNPTGLTNGKSAEEIRAWASRTFPEWVKTAGPGRIACVTIIPGCDDSCQPSRKPPRPVTERHGGAAYKVVWEEAMAANPDWVLIARWKMGMPRCAQRGNMPPGSSR